MQLVSSPLHEAVTTPTSGSQVQGFGLVGIV